MPMTSTHFDPISGVSWSESTVKARSSQTRISRQSMFPAFSSSSSSSSHLSRKRHRSATYQPLTGPASLEELSSRVFLQHTSSVTNDALVGLPLHIGKALWTRIESLNLVTPTLFAAFCRAFPEDPLFSYYRVAEIVPQLSFPEYISLLNSPSLHWLTALTLSNINLSHAELTSLAKLSNLVALDIFTPIDRSSQIDDRTIRAWKSHAEETFAFRNLQVLILRNQSLVTSRVLSMLSSFPKLALFGVKGCGISKNDEAKALRYGWTTHDRYGVLQSVQRDMEQSRTWDGALRACVKWSSEILAGNYKTCRCECRIGLKQHGEGEGEDGEGEDGDEDSKAERENDGQDYGEHQHDSERERKRELETEFNRELDNSGHKHSCNTYDTQKQLEVSDLESPSIPLLNFRLGHTSPDVLGLSTFSPLVVFRCIQHASSSQHDMAVNATAGNISLFAEKENLKAESDMKPKTKTMDDHEDDVDDDNDQKEAKKDQDANGEVKTLMRTQQQQQQQANPLPPSPSPTSFFSSTSSKGKLRLNARRLKGVNEILGSYGVDINGSTPSSTNITSIQQAMEDERKAE